MPVTDPLQGATFIPSWQDAYQLPQTIADMYAFLLARGIPQFTTTAERDGAYPAPADGQMAWADEALYIYYGGWVALWTPPNPSTILAGSGYTTNATSEISSAGWITLSGTLTKVSGDLVRGVTIGTVALEHRPVSDARRSTAAIGVAAPADAGVSGIQIATTGAIILTANNASLVSQSIVYLDGVTYKL
ncbi:hypothetical protein ACFS27_03425 [Promicromonospora vindobonensis]|uniref:Uncharacterized protein n=1 Tax=Promicromonospora vindobonensis TaxID=195748 RepID=A0ABW5VNS0_9MICO